MSAPPPPNYIHNAAVPPASSGHVVPLAVGPATSCDVHASYAPAHGASVPGPGHVAGTSAATAHIPTSGVPSHVPIPPAAATSGTLGAGSMTAAHPAHPAHPAVNTLTSSGLPVLQAFEPALGPQPANATLYSPQQITLVLTEKVWSIGDTFTVQTADGFHVLQVKGKIVSLHGKKKFADMSGTELFVLAEKKLKLHKTFHAEAAAGHNFDIEGNFSIGSSKSTVKFVNASDRRPIELRVRGDWLDRSAKITLGEKTNERVVAQMSRSFMNTREVFGNKQTYYITVAPNVDLSLISAICIAIDERENDK